MQTNKVPHTGKAIHRSKSKDMTINEFVESGTNRYWSRKVKIKSN